jgi:tetratricopeptide (TPR) repeat protein
LRDFDLPKVSDMTFRLTVFLACLFALFVAVPLSDASAQQQRQVDICRDGTPDDQLASCTALIKRGGRDLEAYYANRSRAWQAKQECDLALADAEKALSLKRDEVNVAQVGVVLSDCKGDHARAIKVYSDGIRTWPKSASLYYNRAVALGHLSDPAALEDYNQVLRLNPKHLDSYVGRGLYWMGRIEHEKAIADFTSAIGLKPDLARAYAMRGRAYGDKDERTRALADFERAIKLAPKEAEYYTSRAIFLRDSAETERALEDFAQALRLNPHDSDTLIERGLLRFQQEDYNEAIADFTAALAIKPTSSMALSNRARAYGGLDDRRNALADFERAIELDPKFAFHYVARARFHRALGDFDRALADVNTALNLLPAAVYFETRAQIWQEKGDLRRALDDANESVRRETGSIWSKLRRGIIYRESGDHDRALADLNDFLRRYPFDPEGYVERGAVHEKRGDPTRARADYEKALTARGVRSKSAHAAARKALAALDGTTSPSGQLVVAAPQTVVPALPTPSAPLLARPPAERRVALVIGNSAYRHVAPLANPGQDARAVTASLRAIGFQSVMTVNDASRENLISALREFSREAEKADWAMVYYAGHGIEIGGVNYLVPVDARLEADRDAPLEAVTLEQVLGSLESVRKIRLVVLDACRDNPFAAQMRRTVATRSIGRGLGRIEPEGATLVVYAAKHGQTALDGDGRNSPFAAALTRRLASPDVEINKVFRLIRDDVMDATGGRQEPFTYGSLPGREDFYFVTR